MVMTIVVALIFLVAVGVPIMVLSPTVVLPLLVTSLLIALLIVSTARARS
jgi:hypothetical protein